MKLLGKDLLQLAEAGQGVLLGQIRLTLNERQSVFNKLVVDAVAFLIDPLAGNLLLSIGNIHQRNQLGLAGVLAVHDTALKSDHTAVDTVDSILHSHLTGHEGLLDVGLGGQMRTAALQQVQFDTAHLSAGFFLQRADRMWINNRPFEVVEEPDTGLIPIFP